MSHPVLVRAEKLIRVGDIVGAEAALASLVDSDGDGALIVALDDFAAKDLLAVLRDFDSSKESVVSLLVLPEQFARAIVLERRYGDASHERLQAIINSVIFRADSDPGEFLEAIAAVDGGCDALADYLSDRAEIVEHFFKTGTFGYFDDIDEATAELNDDERLDELSDPEANRPFLSHSEVGDQDWMELTWLLRYEHPEIFRDVLLILRARARAEEPQLASDEAANRANEQRRPPGEPEEESAL
ncbi:MAG: hypothetical protein AW10_02906 [Candidatus Accumulibacter appositus]|uniref:Uncharacterized protein n=1 Tax=Candidatus Accumulibacter appositus TaxID=1454003 RepID=A0A011QI94_9PROT|nr:hypothetical protein [Accumulibacter sp.]EXI78554.1 MAG: hypothetical protein AW10_02906 [Candidatus Accumulibacter appositus]HRF03585.1 hypothetical protein [Accumulibacter sp.]